jgi:protein-tyrosine phosphatase
MPKVLDWRCPQPRDVLVQAVQSLAAGHLVILPTDTSYLACACALNPDAARRLYEIPSTGGRNPRLQVVVTDSAQALDWVPAMPMLGQRLARRAWPGPLVLSILNATRTGLLMYLSDEVAGMLLRDGWLELRAADHDAIVQALTLLPGPVVCRAAQLQSGPEVCDSAALAGSPPAWADLVITDGPTKFSRPATVVEITADAWRVMVPGAVSEEELRQLSGCHIVFVCTGNTCRSPLAEALCKKLLADHLACAPEELPARGFVVQSAGLFALPGQEASPEAVNVARDFGADLAGHRSQLLTNELLLQADHVLAMTASHLHALAGYEPAMLQPPRLLSCEGEDVTDPIGAEPEVYRECARQILYHLQHRLPEFRPN